MCLLDAVAFPLVPDNFGEGLDFMIGAVLNLIHMLTCSAAHLRAHLIGV
jgi:hypothetical protein